jgi:hypothetical protein
MNNRPLRTYLLCAECTEELEDRCEHEGDGASVYCACECAPGHGVFAVWKNGALVLKPCNSAMQAQLWGASIAARALNSSDARQGLSSRHH